MSECDWRNEISPHATSVRNCGHKNDKRQLWTDQETWIMMRIWDDYFFVLRSHRRTLDIYRKMGTDLWDQYAIRRSPRQIQMKIDSLTQKHRRLSEAMNSGRQRHIMPKWPFYWEVQRILGKCETTEEQEKNQNETDEPLLSVELREFKYNVNPCIPPSPQHNDINDSTRIIDNFVSEAPSMCNVSSQGSFESPTRESLDFRKETNSVPCNNNHKRKLNDILEELVQVQREQVRGTEEYQRENVLLLREQLILQRESLSVQSRLVSVLERLLTKQDTHT